MDVGFLTAFLGGALALLSPCAALLLPAFFASSVGSGARLLAHAGVFYLGLMALLTPLALGAGAVGEALADHRELLVGATSALIVVIGVVQLFGGGVDLSRMIPGVGRLREQAAERTGLMKSLLLGAVSGVAGFCTGPILGAVLTLAATRGMAGSVVLLAVYAAGMVVPLVLIAWGWQRLGERGRSLLRGREFTALGRRWHTTSVITGLLLIAVGILFWMTNGLIGVDSPIPLDTQSWLQSGARALSRPEIDIALIFAGVIGVIVWWARARRRAVAGR